MPPSNRAVSGKGAFELMEQFRKECFINLMVPFFLKWIDEHGYILVPKPHAPPARRGKTPTYTGPGWIGKSHSARLAGGQ